MNRRRVSIQVFLCFLMMMFLMVAAGCSGSDNAAAPAQTISGKAAAGGAIIGTVTIKDANGVEHGPTTIAADGSYSIDVSGMPPPYALRADGYVGGREYHLYSGAVSTDVNGTINITPFTDLIIANMAGQIAASYYTSGNFSSLTPDALATAETALQTILQPILTAMGIDAGIDLLRTSFNTDHTGLDAVIDVVKVTVDPVTVQATLTNVINNETVTLNIAAGGTTTDPAFTDTGVTPAVVTDFQAMFTAWTVTFTNLFATGLPSETALGALIADPFLEGGQDRGSWLTRMTTDSTNIGMKITSVNLVSLDEANGKATVTITGTQGGGKTMNGPDAGYCLMVKQGGTWKYAGDGRIAKVGVTADAQYYPYNSGTQIQTGLNLDIEANYTAGAAVQSAVVTGPGLPSGGITLNRQINNEWFYMTAYSSYYTDNHYIMTNDAVIGAIPDNAEYTIKLYNAADGTGTVLATYTSTILKRPLKNSELTTASFPTITPSTQAALEAFSSSGNLTVTWTLPAGLSSDWLQLQLRDTDGTHSMEVDANNLMATDTSTTLTVTTAPTFTVAHGQLWLDAVDAYNRRFSTEIWLF